MALLLSNQTGVAAAPPVRKGMASAGSARRGDDDLELAGKLATIAMSSPLVRRLDSDVLRYVSRAATVRTVRAGEVIAASGQREDGLFVVLRGHVGVEGCGTELDLFESLGPGEICGAEPLVPGTPALARLRARTAVELMIVPYGVARILAARDPHVAELLAQRSERASIAALLHCSRDVRADVATAVPSLAGAARFITIPERECILAESTVSDSVYLLTDGAVEIAIPHPTSGFREVRFDQRGALLGRASLFGAAERAAAWTTTPCQLLRIPRRAGEHLMRTGVLDMRASVAPF